jgi:NAD(P)-dependent dehydrogenase (short-subunit alcohol dehydrogenase family)
MATILVTGANRGIGLELCRQLAERGDDVIGACRTPSEELEALNIDVIGGVDVTDDISVEGLRSALGTRQLDILIHNAGILQSDTFESLDFDAMRRQFEVNTLGPLRVIRALADNLHEGSKVGIVSSRVGSIEDNASGNNYGYRVSKTAVNMVGKNLSHDLSKRGIAVVLLHPGFVATRMTGGRGIEPAAAAAGLIARMDDLTLDKTGTFWHAEDYALPW